MQKIKYSCLSVYNVYRFWFQCLKLKEVQWRHKSYFCAFRHHCKILKCSATSKILNLWSCRFIRSWSFNYFIFCCLADWIFFAAKITYSLLILKCNQKYTIRSMLNTWSFFIWMKQHSVKTTSISIKYVRLNGRMKCHL